MHNPYVVELGFDFIVGALKKKGNAVKRDPPRDGKGLKDLARANRQAKANDTASAKKQAVLVHNYTKAKKLKAKK